MLSFLYQEAVGGAVFLIGLWLAFRSGELGWKGGPGKRTALLVAGLVFLALIQGLLQWAAHP
jgi:hypothetical protein